MMTHVGGFINFSMFIILCLNKRFKKYSRPEKPLSMHEKVNFLKIKQLLEKDERVCEISFNNEYFEAQLGLLRFPFRYYGRG